MAREDEESEGTLKAVAVKLDRKTRARLDALAEKIPTLDGAPRTSRSTALRLVIARGLAAAEKEFGT